MNYFTKAGFPFNEENTILQEIKLVTCDKWDIIDWDFTIQEYSDCDADFEICFDL